VPSLRPTSRDSRAASRVELEIELEMSDEFSFQSQSATKALIPEEVVRSELLPV
jgi:hypothetical protein